MLGYLDVEGIALGWLATLQLNNIVGWTVLCVGVLLVLVAVHGDDRRIGVVEVYVLFIGKNRITVVLIDPQWLHCSCVCFPRMRSEEQHVLKVLIK